MTTRTLTGEEITRNKISTTAARVALHAEQEAGNYDSKMDNVDDLISDLYTGDLDRMKEDHVVLMRSVIMGTLHSSSVALAGFEGTAGMGEIIGRMGSSHRPSPKNPNEPIYMIEAVTDAVIVEVTRTDGTIDAVLRHYLKTDLSNVFDDFAMLRKRAVELAAAQDLFGGDYD